MLIVPASNVSVVIKRRRSRVPDSVLDPPSQNPPVASLLPRTPLNTHIFDVMFIILIDSLFIILSGVDDLSNIFIAVSLPITSLILGNVPVAACLL
jgi:hypothetical protein